MIVPMAVALSLGIATSLAGDVTQPMDGPGCADHWQVTLDEESFAHNGAAIVFAPADLAAFHKKVESALTHAVDQACAEGSIEPGVAQSVHRVTIFSASGATEPHIYAAGDRDLHFEWIFAEEGLAIPPDPEIVAAAACWINPDDAACAEQGD